MATLTLDLHDDLVAKLGSVNLAVELPRIAALALFREGKVSIPRAAELACTPLEEFKVFARAHGVEPPGSVDSDEPERERRAIEYLDSLNLSVPPWLEHAWQASRENGTDQITLEEINEEIAAARGERRERKNSQRQ
jgi:predicted HTH domain antitoxin